MSCWSAPCLAKQCFYIVSLSNSFATINYAHVNVHTLGGEACLSFTSTVVGRERSDDIQLNDTWQSIVEDMNYYINKLAQYYLLLFIGTYGLCQQVE